MANKNLDNSSFASRISMSALRERTHLQKRLIKYDQEEEKQLQKIKQSQECLIKDLKGSELDRQNADLLTKQKKVMELRRARFSAPALDTVKRPGLPQLSDPSMEGDNDVKVQDLLLLPSGKTPSSTLKVMRRRSQSSSQSSSATASPRELLRKDSESRNILVNRAGSKQEKISLKPPPLQFNWSSQQHLRLNNEGTCKSPSETAMAEADIAIVDIEQEVENSGDKEDQKEFWKVLVRRGTPDSGCVTQSVRTQEGKEEETAQSQETRVSKDKKNKRRRKIGIHHCVNEIAPAFNENVLSNEESSTQFIDGSRESRPLSTMSYIDEQRGPWKMEDSSNGSTVNKAMQMRRASSLSQISTSSGRKTSFSGTEKNASTSRLGLDGPPDLRRHGDVYTDINTPQLIRKLSLNQRVLCRSSDNELGRAKKDSSNHLDSDDNGECKNSVTQMAALENFRRLAFLSLGSKSSFSGSGRATENSASTKPQQERKLSRARLEEIQKPTESSSRQLITKHRSVSVLGTHPKLHQQLSAPELRRSIPSGPRNFRKLSNSVVATKVLSAKQRRWSSVIKPTSPMQVNEEKTLSEMMTDVKDCRYLRNSVTCSSTESDS